MFVVVLVSCFLAVVVVFVCCCCLLASSCSLFCFLLWSTWYAFYVRPATTPARGSKVGSYPGFFGQKWSTLYSPLLGVGS